MRLKYSQVIEFFKSIWSGILGISVEIAFAYFFILIGFLVCLFWWSVIR